MSQEITGHRKQQLIEAANLLLDARRNGTSIADLPVELQPASLEEAYLVQDEMIRAYLPIGGWKVGAPGPDQTPFFAPMPTAWIAASGSTVASGHFRGLEAEISFHMGADLLPRSTPYTRAEMIAAIESCHPAIEVLEVAFTDVTAVQKMTMFGDMQMHGGFVYGPAVANWQQIDFSKESVTLSVDGVVRVERTASNPGGTDLIRLMLHLVNEGAARTGGLKKGDWITTGSWTGNTIGSAGSSVHVHFTNAGDVTMKFA